LTINLLKFKKSLIDVESCNHKKTKYNKLFDSDSLLLFLSKLIIYIYILLIMPSITSATSATSAISAKKPTADDVMFYGAMFFSVSGILAFVGYVIYLFISAVIFMKNSYFT
jgi:hypothetical protein